MHRNPYKNPFLVQTMLVSTASHPHPRSKKTKNMENGKILCFSKFSC